MRILCSVLLLLALPPATAAAATLIDPQIGFSAERTLVVDGRSYRGKKKRHTLKAQFVVDRQTRQIICTAFGREREHDFRLFKRS